LAEGDAKRSASAKQLLEAAQRSLARAQADSAEVEGKTAEQLRTRDAELRREKAALDGEYEAAAEEAKAARKRAAAAEGRLKAAQTRARNLRETIKITDPVERTRKVASADASVTRAQPVVDDAKSQADAAARRAQDLATRRRELTRSRAVLRTALSRANEVARAEEANAQASADVDRAEQRAAKAAAKPAAPPARRRPPPRRPKVPAPPAGGGPSDLTQAYIDARQRAEAVTYARRKPQGFDDPAVVKAQRARLIEQFSLSDKDLTDDGQTAANAVAAKARAAAQAQENLLQGTLPTIGQAGQIPRATKPNLGTKAFATAVEKLKQIPSVQLELYTYYERAMKAGVTGANAIDEYIKAEIESERASTQVARNAASRAERAAAKAKAKPKAPARVTPPKPVPSLPPVTPPAVEPPADNLESLQSQRAALAKQRTAAASGLRAADRRLAAGDPNGRSAEAWDKAQERMRATYDKHDRSYNELSDQIGKLDERIAAIKQAADVVAKPSPAVKAAPAAPKPAPAPPQAKPPARVTARPSADEGRRVGNQAEYEKLVRENAELLARNMSAEQRDAFHAAVAPTPPERQEQAVRELKTAVDRNAQSQIKGAEVGKSIVPRTLANANVPSRAELDAIEALHNLPTPGPLAGQYPYVARQGQVTRSRVESEIGLPAGPRSPLQDAGARLKAAQDAASQSGRDLRKYNRDTTKYTQQQGEDFERVHRANVDRVDALRKERKAIETSFDDTIADTQARNLAENERIRNARRPGGVPEERSLQAIEATAQDVVATPPRPREPIPNERALVPYQGTGERIGAPRETPPVSTHYDAVGTLAEEMAEERARQRAANAGFSGGGGGGMPPRGPFGGMDPNEWDDDLKNMRDADARLAGSLRQSEDAMRRWNAQLGISDQSMRKHGTFTTEFIEAARKGDVAYREWGWQIGAAAAKFGAWTAAGAGIYAAIGAVQKVGQGAVDSASAIPSIERTLPNLNAGQAQRQLRQLSTDFAVPISTSADAVMRMGAVYRDQAEAIKAAHVALLAYRTGEVDVGTATTQLTAIATGMGVSAGGLADIFDRLNYVQNNYGVRIPDLLTGTARLSAAWRQAGGDADHLVALVTALNRTAGVSGAQSATILGRMIGNVNRPSSKSVLEQYGIPTDPSDIQGTVTKAIEVANGPLAKPSDVQAIAKALAGGTQYQRQLVALLQDPKIYNKLLGEEQAGKYKGSGQKELEKVMQTWQMRLAEIGTQLGNLGSNLAQGGFLTALGLGVGLLTLMLKTVNGVLEVFNLLPAPLKSGLAAMLTLVALLRTARRLGIGSAFEGRLGGAGDRIAPFLNETPGRTARRNVSKGLNDAVKVYQDDFESTTRTARAANVTQNNAVRRARREREETLAQMNRPLGDPQRLDPATGFERMRQSDAKAQRAVDRYIDAEIAQTNAANRLKAARDDLAAFERDQASGPRSGRNQRALNFANRIGAYGPASLPRDQPSPEQVRRYGRPTPGGLPTFVIGGTERTGAEGAGTRGSARASGVRYTFAGDAATLFGKATTEAADAAKAAAAEAQGASEAFRNVSRNISLGPDGNAVYGGAQRGPRSTMRGRITRVTTNVTDAALAADAVEAAGTDRARRFRQEYTSASPTTGFNPRQRFRDFEQNFNARRQSGAPGTYGDQNLPYSASERFRASASTIGLRGQLAGQRALDSIKAIDPAATARKAQAQIGSSLSKVKGSLKGIGTSITELVSPAELLLAGIIALPAIFAAAKSAIDKFNKDADASVRNPKTIEDKTALLGELATRADQGTTNTERYFKFSDDVTKPSSLIPPLAALNVAKGVAGLFGIGDNDYAKQRQAAAKAQLDAYRKLQAAQNKARAEGRDVPELTGDEIDKDLSVTVNRYQAGRATLDQAIAATQKALREVDKTTKLNADEKADKKETLLNDLAQLNKEKQDKIKDEIDAQNAALEALVNSGAAPATQLNAFIAKQVALINQFRGDTSAEGMQKYAAARQSLVDTLKNAGSGDTLDSALTNAMGDPEKIAEAYRKADKQFSAAYRTAKGANTQTTTTGGRIGGNNDNDFSTGKKRTTTTRDVDPELAAELKAIKRQRQQSQFEYMRAIAEARTEVQAGNADAGLPRARVQLSAIGKLVQQAIKVYGRNSKETLGLIAQQQQAEATVVQEQASLITARADYAAAGESTEAGSQQVNISGLNKLLAFQQANPKQYGEADILGTKTQIREARKALADQVRQQAEDLLNARYELLESQTDDPVAQAKLEAERTAAVYKRGGFTNAADKMRAKAAANNAKREAQNSAVQAQIDDIDFDVEIGKTTRDQQIAAYERLLKTATMSQQMKKQLKQQIARLKHDAETDNEGAFELGLDKIRVPTLYEVARLVKGGPGNVTSAVNNANTVNVTVNGPQDYDELGRVLEAHVQGAGKATARAAQMR
jgi:TP901 family phage tail tape measure protein